MYARWFAVWSVFAGWVVGWVMSAGLAFAGPLALPTDPSMLIGDWLNDNPATDSIVEIVIESDGVGGMTVHGYGACTPTPCDWGVVGATPYSRGVEDVSGIAFTASYDFGFKDTMLAGKVKVTENGAGLSVLSFNKFKDGSDRYDYATHDRFRKD